MKEILILDIKDGKEGQPSYERVKAFKEFYNNNGFNVISIDTPSSFRELFKLILIIYKRNTIESVFLSMPPFKNWILFLFFKNKIILDIRDGWSIAMLTGYGETVLPKKKKAKVARFIERFAINRAKIIISCTLGLVKYLEDLSNNKIIFIPNGFSQKDMSIVKGIECENRDNDDLIKMVCVGKFSEYGKDKIKALIKKVKQQFSDKRIQINLVGTNFEQNKWTLDYVKNINKLDIIFTDRLGREDMYKEIMKNDFGITIIRDINYDYGTKVYDYILCDIPVFNFYKKNTPFTSYFKGVFHDDFNKHIDKSSYHRSLTIQNKKTDLI
ncbi:hypothetical protein [Tenacibaculum ovolyticum]|uniref:hypothetical protein n=1 Tax=Tenacibaculum ovolyticum TaxID=104270 RepID=UPI003BAC893A